MNQRQEAIRKLRLAITYAEDGALYTAATIATEAARTLQLAHTHQVEVIQQATAKATRPRKRK